MKYNTPKTMKVIFLLYAAILIGVKNNSLYSQNNPSKYKKYPIEFSIGNFSVGVPFSKIFINRVYPFATLGTEFYYRNKKHFQLYQTAKAGGYYNKYSTSALFINTEIGYRYKISFGLFADANLGVGYSHLFRPNAIYHLNSGGKYEQKRDWGKPSPMVNYSFAMGYEFAKHSQKPKSVFLRYGNYSQLFYNIPDIPILPQNSFQIGLRFSTQ